MVARDRVPHAALKQVVVLKINVEGFEAVLARLQWSKDEVSYSQHAKRQLFTCLHRFPVPQESVAGQRAAARH